MRGSILRVAMGLVLALGSLFALPLMPSTLAAQIACDPAAPAAASGPLHATPAAIAETPFPEDGGTLTVFAAASLTDAFNEFATGLETTNPNLDIGIQTAGSQTLVTQLVEGATADVLAIANTSTMDTATESGVVTGDPVTFTGNRLVLVTPQDNPAGIESINDLASDDILLVIANEWVPAGNYARVAFCAWGASGSAPEGFVDNVAANIASEEEDVRNVLAKVQLGEADAGIVYASDATASELAGSPLNVIEFPSTVPTRASYPIAAVNGGQTDLANAFIAAILSPEGQAILARYGFER